MALLNQQHLNRAKEIIFTKGRLLERQLYRYFFEDGSRKACLKALLSYQNADGGFGNGLEPDLICPGSSAIGTESALFALKMPDYQEPDIILPMLAWLEANQADSGAIHHPSSDLKQYPYQLWWDKEDGDRQNAIAGMLSAWQDSKPKFFKKARHLYQQSSLPEILIFYDYHCFVYLAFCHSSAEALAKHYHHNLETFQLLCDVVMNDSFKRTHERQDNPRKPALEALLFYYSENPKAFEILHDRALNDPDEQLREWAQQQLEKLEKTEEC